MRRRFIGVVNKLERAQGFWPSVTGDRGQQTLIDYPAFHTFSPMANFVLLVIKQPIVGMEYHLMEIAPALSAPGLRGALNKARPALFMELFAGLAVA
jgi:hypothetical protein